MLIGGGVSHWKVKEQFHWKIKWHLQLSFPITWPHVTYWKLCHLKKKIVCFLFSNLICTNIFMIIIFRQSWPDLFESHACLKGVFVYCVHEWNVIPLLLHIPRNSVQVCSSVVYSCLYCLYYSRAHLCLKYMLAVT